ncbi:hypothetical protein [Paraglaciecola chathamensis]|uniref:Uncharacterized protein n=1 Tax=Paraglaciecola chathamensis S18K6 TaxID=1127672 RepID=A0AAV3UTI8_9ALTE|nr:hypothetical protein [Paraglaciecola chathamensis]GAC08513.1 hypothetical protein GCHA_0550 [Paraglaciecola chathamensis S18K6]
MSAIVNLALLESLKAHDFKDEIDLYIPFLANTILQIDEIPFNAAALAKQFKQKFGFKPPEAVIKVLLVRAKKKGLVRLENHLYVPLPKALAPYREIYDSNREKLQVAIDSVIADLVGYAKEQFDKQISPERAEGLLLNFIEKNVSSLITHKSPKQRKEHAIKNEAYVIASYIASVSKSNSRNWEGIQTLLKGVVLANYLFFADKTAESLAKRKYSNLSVYLDTPLIIAYLGFSGNLSQTVVKELISLLSKLEVKIFIFDRTLREIESLFDAWIRDFRKGNTDNFNPSTLHLLISKGHDAASLETKQALIETELKENGIQVKYGANLDHNYVCDENGLEEHLKKNKAVSQAKNGIEHDVICISRVHNYRKGKAVRSLSDTFSVFVTPNTSLIKYANSYLSHDIGTGIPVVISETWLTTIFWLKHQDAYGDLPTQSLVSHAYSTLNKADSVWENFLFRFKKLSTEGIISDETVQQVRYHKNLLKEVNDYSVEIGDDFSDENVLEIVNRVNEKNAQVKQEAVSKAVKIVEDKHKRSEAQLKLVASKVSRIESGIEKVASWIAALFTIVLISFFGLGAYYSLIGVSLIGGNSSIALLIASLITISMHFLGAIWGVTFTSIFKKLSKLISEKLTSMILEEIPSDKERLEPVIKPTGSE